MADVTIVIKTIDQTTAQTKKIGSGLKDMASQFAMVSGIVLGLGAALKKTFDLAAQGAQINQLSAATESMGVNMDALRAASKGTISDFQLMNAAQTLLIGTSGELKEAFLGNADRLLEIAKAANKLNPALGDTDFLYRSIATGIKRSSPLILDNLGLIVKVGEANEAYARTLGKTVGELSAEERQMALLNATLQAGNVLIDQAGNVADGGADAFQHLAAAIANTADEIKRGLGNALKGVAEELANGIDMASVNRRTMRELSDAYQAGYISTEKYNELIIANTQAQYDAARAEVDRAQALGDMIDMQGEVIPGLEEYYNGTEKASAGNDRFLRSLRDANGATAELSQETRAARDALSSYYDLVTQGIPAFDFGEQAQTMDWLDIGGQALIEFNDHLAWMAKQGVIGPEKYRKELEKGAVAQAAIKVAAGDTSSAWADARAIADQFGLDVYEVYERIMDINGALGALNNKHTKLVFDIETNGEIPAMPVSPTPAEANVPITQGEQATGSSWLVGGSGGTDSQYVGFMASPGEQITVDTPGNQGRGGGRTTYIYNYIYGANISMDVAEDILGVRV